MRHIPRFYCPDATLAASAQVLLPDGPAHHARVVLRLKDGAMVKLFNPRDGEWEGTCHYPDKRSVSVTLMKQLTAQENLADVWLVLAPLKNKDAFDNALRHAVELGVTAIQLVQTSFTQQTKLNMERLQQQLVDAAQQCGRLSVPELKPFMSLDKMLAGWPAERVLLACVEGSETIPGLKDVAAAKSAMPTALLVGPEGGFSDIEKNQLMSGPSWLQPVSLGSLILRSDTAVAAALGCLL